MYVLFRDDLIDSDEIRKKIESESDFHVISDLTKATKREDVMSFKLSLPMHKISLDTVFDWDVEDSVNEYFGYAENLTKDFLKYFPKYTIQCSNSYKWNEVDNSIELVVVIANIDITMKKLKLDILKRMMKQVD